MQGQTADERKHRLVPTRQVEGRFAQSWVIVGWSAAVASAEDFFKENGVPVLICAADENGHACRNVQTIGVIEPAKRIKRAA